MAVRSGVVTLADLVNGIDHGRNIFRVNIRVNAVTKVEHMAAARAKPFQYLADLFVNNIRLGIQNGRIEIAL